MRDKNGIEMYCSNCRYHSRNCIRCALGNVGFVASRDALERHIAKLYDEINDFRARLRKCKEESSAECEEKERINNERSDS